jgi:glutamate synthase (NADPH/NADH) large chain
VTLHARTESEVALQRAIAVEGQILLGWRDVPTDNSCLGRSVRPSEPVIRQIFIKRGAKLP